MKLRILSIISVAALFLTSCYQNDIDNLQQQINELKGGEIATISTQVTNINASISDLQKTENALSGYITSLQTDNASVKKQVSSLSDTDKTLSTKITELSQYVNNELKSSSDWVSATFATLAQYDSLAALVAALPTQVASITSELDSVQAKIVAGYEKAINDAVEDSEESMKKWINEKLVDYYTISEVNAILDSIATKQSLTDSTLNASIVEQQVALDTAKSQITEAYKKAIKEAIEKSEGVINEKIATDIAAAKTALNNTIKGIQDQIDEIKGKITEFETKIAALINRVQSVVVVPTYSDGDVQIQTGASIIRFDVRPLSVAEALVTSAAKDSSIFSFNLVETLTKGAAPAELDVVAFTFNQTTKMIDVTVNASESFFGAGAKKYSANFVIKSGDVSKGGINKSSSYFALYPKVMELKSAPAGMNVVQL